MPHLCAEVSKEGSLLATHLLISLSFVKPDYI